MFTLSDNERKKVEFICSQMLVCFILVFCSAFAVAEARQKRSDDTNPLQQVVQQQAQDIELLKAELTALRNTVTAQQNTVTAQQSTIQQLTIRVNKAVSFTAYSSKDPFTTGNHGVLLLDTVVTNIGNGYNTLTGIFTAPYSGTYLFLVNIMTNGVTSTVAIDKSGTVLAETYAHKDNTWDKGTAHVTVHLNSGDQVWARHFNNDQTLVGNMWSTFSGMLLHAD